MHSALGRGSHHSVVAGVHHKALSERAYHPLARDYVRLRMHQRKLESAFMLRDVVFQNKFPEADKVNGVFRLTPQQRRDYHYSDIMTGLRRRSLMLQRMSRQRAVNTEAVKKAADSKAPAEDPRASLGTPDSDVYFLPASSQQRGNQQQSQSQSQSQLQHFAYNTYPNFWQHPTRRDALVPRPRWERHPELGGITRVHQAPSLYANHY